MDRITYRRMQERDVARVAEIERQTFRRNVVAVDLHVQARIRETCRRVKAQRGDEEHHSAEEPLAGKSSGSDAPFLPVISHDRNYSTVRLNWANANGENIHSRQRHDAGSGGAGGGGVSTFHSSKRVFWSIGFV